VEKSVLLPESSSPRGEEEQPAADQYRRQLETVANNATLGLFIMDERQHCTFMNRAAEQLTGFRLEEVQGEPLHDFIHHTRPDGSPYPLSECPIDSALPHNSREQGEEVFVHRDGHFYPVAYTASPILDGGRPLGTIIEVRDISEEKRAAAERERLLEDRGLLIRQLNEERGALELERARLASAFSNAPAFMATLSGPDHVYEMTNPAYDRIVGFRARIGKPIREVLPEVVEQGFIDLLDQVYRTGTAYVGTEVPVLLHNKPGAEPQNLVVNFVFQPLTDRSGAVTGILVHGVDVTELAEARRTAEDQAFELQAQTEKLRWQAKLLEETQSELEIANEELSRANHHLEERAAQAERSRVEAEEARAEADFFYQAAPVPTALVDRDLRFKRINRALATFYGLRPDDVVGKSLGEVVPAYAAQIEPFYRKVLDTGMAVENVEVRVPSRTDPSHLRNFLVNYFPVQVREGEVIGVGVVALDVTERHQMEEAQREQAALADTIQRFGRSVASELDLGAVVQAVTDAATLVTGAELGAFLYDVVGDGGEAQTLYTISGVDTSGSAGVSMPRANLVSSSTFRGEAVARSGDLRNDVRYRETLPFIPWGDLPVASYLAVPVISRTGEVVGSLFLGHSQTSHFEERHERLVEGVAGWAAVAMDNSRLYQAERVARGEAERANRVKSEFLATMSHELRTPLNAMIGYADLLTAGVPEPISASAQVMVDRIGVSARHLLELIEEILTFSRLEAGEERVEKDVVSPADLIAEVHALMEPLALSKGIAFRSHAPTDVSYMTSDARKIRQILINLIGNGIKFTERGEVRLTLEENESEMVFEIQDTGAGIEERNLDRIFDPFWQVESGSTRNVGGTGLGLSVTRRLARLLGGDVSVTSTVDVGSTFYVRLPREAPAAPPKENAEVAL
jgi:PAS domain S-box-containing protein